MKQGLWSLASIVVLCLSVGCPADSTTATTSQPLPPIEATSSPAGNGADAEIGALMALGDSEYAAKNYAAADKAYTEALGSARKRSVATPEMYARLAELNLEWMKSPALSQSEKAQKYNKARGCYKEALRVDSTNLKCRQRLTAMVWEEATLMARWPEFIKEADALLALDDKDHLTYYRRGVANAELARNMGETYVQPAMADFQKAIELKKNESEYWITYAQFTHRKIGAVQAEEIYKKAIEAIPDKALPHVAYGDFLAGAKDTLAAAGGPAATPRDLQKEARAQYEEAARVEPKNAQGYLSYAAYYLRSSNLAEAAKKLEDAKAADPTDYRPYRELAMIATRQGDRPKGMGILKEGIRAIRPRPVTSTAPGAEEMEQRRVGTARAELNLLLVNSLLDECEGKAVKERTPLIDEAKGLRDRLAPLGKVVMDRMDGRIAFSEGRMDEARRLLEFAYENGAFDPQAAYLLIQTYMALGMPGKATPIIEKFQALPDSERNPIGNLLRAPILLQMHDLQEALREVNKALAKQPDNPTALKMKLDIEAMLGKEMPKDFKLDPARVPLFLERANALWAEEHRDEAVKMVEEMHDRLPDDLRIISQLAQYYTLRKQEDKAKDLISKALEKDPNNEALKRAGCIPFQPDPEKRLQMMIAERQAIVDPAARHLALAQLYGMFDKPADYRRELDEAIKADPKNMTVIELRFRLALSGTPKDFGLADECIKQATEVNPLTGKFFKARLAMVKSDFPSAVSLLGDMLRDQPDNKQWKVMLGDCYMQMNDLAKAEAQYKEVAEVDFGYAPAILGMAKVTETLGKWAEHARYVEQGHKLVPQDPYIQQEYLRIQVDKLSPKEAITHLTEWLKKKPDDVQTLIRLASLYEKTRQWDEAERIYRSVYDRAMEKLQPARWLIGFYLKRGQAQEIEGVLNQLTDARVAPDRVGVFVLVGDIRMVGGAKGAMDRAKDAYQMAIDKDPKEPRGYAGMANFYAAQGKWADAVEAQRQFLDRQGSAEGEKTLAKFLIEAGQLQEAADRLKRVLDKAPSDPDALGDLAGVLTRLGHMKEAVGILNRAVQANPSAVDPLLRRASLLIVLGEPEKAAEDLKAVPRVSPSAEAIRQAANLYLRMRKEAEAESMFNEALARQEDYRAARVELAQLYLVHRNWERLDPLLDRGRTLFPSDVAFPRIRAEEKKRRADAPGRAKALEEAYGMTQGADRGVTADYIASLLEINQPDPIAKAQEVIQKEMAANRGGIWLDSLRARTLAAAKKSDEADELFKTCVKQATPDEIGVVLEQVEKAYGPEQGRKTLEGWVSLRPNDYVMLEKLADLRSRSRKTEDLKEACKLLTKALELAQKPEEKASVESGLGTMYHQIAQREKSAADLVNAEKHYLASLKGNANNASVLNNLAYLYAESRNQPDKGLLYAEMAVKLLPNNADALDTYGWTLHQLGEPEKAEAVLVRALQADRPAPVVRYHLGYLYEKRGELEKAMMQYQLGLNMLTEEDKQEEVSKQLKDGFDRVKERQKR